MIASFFSKEERRKKKKEEEEEFKGEHVTLSSKNVDTFK